MIEDRKGISALQLHRQIGGGYEKSWRMLKLIRMAMGDEENKELFEAIVGLMRRIIGGKPRKGSDEDEKRKRHSKNACCRSEREIIWACESNRGETRRTE
ncbi:MAG: hypothetical protein LBU24_00445 [Methanocalculaceae archaeon]|nr:hypothetical protein [Methanocalculaceae archaeon]